MISTQTIDYPVHLLKYPAKLATSSTMRHCIMVDEYIFATYFTTIMQCFKLDDDKSRSELVHIVKSVIPDFQFSPTIGFEHDLEKQDQMARIIDNLRKQFNEHITTTYVYDFFFAMSVYRQLINLKSVTKADAAFETIINVITEKSFKMFNDKYGSGDKILTVMECNLNWLQDILELTDTEANLIDVALLLTYDIRFIVFRDMISSIFKSPTIAEHMYTTMISDQDPQYVSSTIDALTPEKSKPIALGIVSYDAKSKRINNTSEFWVYVIGTSAVDTNDFYNRFVEKIDDTEKVFSGAIAKLSVVDEKALNDFINYSVEADENETTALNVLLYGSSSLNRTDLLKQIFDKNNVTGFVAKTKNVTPRDIPGICYLAQQIVTRNQYYRSVLVIDKAEQALTRQLSRPAWMMDMFGDSLSDEIIDQLNSDNMLLSQNNIPTIWMTTSPSAITPENMGRFLFHAELKGGSRSDRRSEIDKTINELGFSQELALHLSKYQELGVEQIKSAARMTKMLNQNEEQFIHYITNSQKALGREKMEDLRDSVTKYNLDLLNLSGNMPIEKIITALQKKKVGTMCLYGPPGTGKTQLAEYIAVQLDKPLIIKPASELLSMYLGETEKNITKMFEEAKAENAVLLLDEADSFLRDRALANRSWEITQVNELLQRMERFQGVFICATNLFSALDAAALRRFTFKLEFQPLTMSQRIKMLENETGLDFSKLSQMDHENLMMELMLIKYLTPGDFATVRRQAILLDEELSIKDWLTRLEIETKAKLVGVQRNTYLTEEGGNVTPKQHGD